MHNQTMAEQCPIHLPIYIQPMHHMLDNGVPHQTMCAQLRTLHCLHMPHMDQSIVVLDMDVSIVVLPIHRQQLVEELVANK
jgi:hypothetical protein